MKKLVVSLFMAFAATGAYGFVLEEYQYNCQDEIGSTFSIILSYDLEGEMAIAIAYPGETTHAVPKNAIDLIWQDQARSFRFYWLNPGDDEQNNVCDLAESSAAFR